MTGTTFPGTVTAWALALFPFVILSTLFYGGVNTKVFYFVALTVALALITAWRLYKGEATPRLWPRPLLLGILLALLGVYAAAYLGVYPARSLWSDVLRSTGSLFVTHVVVFAYLLEYLTSEDWSRIRRGIALSSAAFATIAVVSVLYRGKFLWLDLSKNGLSFGNDTFAASYLLLAFVLICVEWARTTEEKWRRILATCAALVVVSPFFFNTGTIFGKVPLADVANNPLLLLGSARASALTLLAFLVFLGGRYLIIRYARNMGRMLRSVWTGVFGAGVVASIVLLLVPGSSLQLWFSENVSNARPLVWQAAEQAIQERPWFGWGPENFMFAADKYLDNRLFIQETVTEVWFDRAHNVVLDALVSVGLVGSLLLLLATGLYLYTLRRAFVSERIGGTEAVLMGAVPFAHLLQLQTAFNTVGTYVLVGICIGYALWLERQGMEESAAPRRLTIGLAVLLAVFALASGKWILWDEYARQAAHYETFASKGTEAQLAAMDRALWRTSDFEGLRLSSGSFERGILAQMEKAENPEPYTKLALLYGSRYEQYYQAYLAEAPGHYRARLNYAYLLILKTTWGEDRLDEAKQIIQDSYALSPANPLTYTLDATIELYRGNFEEADRLISEAEALNPDIPFTKNMAEYIRRQIASFPNIVVLQLPNL